MKYPQPGAYQEALQFPATAFSDPDLREGMPAINALGLPQPITGAFAAVFSIDTPQGRFAAKCFLTEVGDQQARYKAVSRHLDRHHLPFMVDYVYLPRGIRVGDEWFPLLKMAWVDGTPLNQFVERHLEEPDRLLELAEAWKALVADLADAGVAHGDLQHGNVLVGQREVDGIQRIRLHLVDYDTLFVPGLAGRKSPEIGHRNYQHPDRSERDFDVSLDQFSSLVIYLAIRVCAVAPDLWSEHDTGENLLFQAGDFYNPDASRLFQRLEGIPELTRITQSLKTACLLEPRDAPDLASVLLGREQAARGPRGRRRRASGVQHRAVHHSGRAMPGVALVVMAILLVGVFIDPPLGLALGAACAAVGLGLAAIAYRRLPSVQRRKRLAREMGYIDRVLAELSRQADRFAAERERVIGDREGLRAERLEEIQREALRDRLKMHFIDELENLEGVSHRAVVRLKMAGIRNAFHLTEERLSEVSGLADTTRVRIAQWRAVWARRYANDVPQRLSTAEEQRLTRFVQRRVEQLAAEQGRLLGKLDVQRGERCRVRDRLDETPELSYAGYVWSLLGGGGGLRKGRTDSPVPTAIVRTRDEGVEAKVGKPGSAGGRDAVEGPWWESKV